MEAENIIIEDSVLDEIIMHTFPEQHFRCLRNFPLSLSVHLKTGCAGKTKKLRLLEVPNDVLIKAIQEIVRHTSSEKKSCGKSFSIGYLP